MMRTQFSRRALMGAMATIPLAGAAVRTSAAQGEASLVDSIVIDLPSTPESIDPALAYSPRVMTADVSSELVIGLVGLAA